MYRPLTPTGEGAAMTISQPTSLFGYVSMEAEDSCRDLHTAPLYIPLGITRFSTDTPYLLEARSRSPGDPSYESTTPNRFEKQYSTTQSCL